MKFFKDDAFKLSSYKITKDSPTTKYAPIALGVFLAIFLAIIALDVLGPTLCYRQACYDFGEGNEGWLDRSTGEIEFIE
jgi:hypothetical protein